MIAAIVSKMFVDNKLFFVNILGKKMENKSWDPLSSDKDVDTEILLAAKKKRD